MQSVEQRFSVIAEVRVPPFRTERLFVATERERVEREIARLGDQHGLGAVIAGLGEPKVEDWKHYLRALKHYEDQLDHHASEIEDGLIPVKLFVVNEGNKDERIHTRVRVVGGTIHPAKEAPRRPRRIDSSSQHVPESAPAAARLETIVSGFARRGIKLGTHSVEAEFSELEAGDSADLINQVIYIAADEGTFLTYTIGSEGLGEESEEGQVVVR